MQRLGAILILDNERAIVQLIGETLSDEGYLVRTSFDCASSLAQSPALILLDSAMPARTVAEALEYTRSLSYPVPVVITTTSPSIAATSLLRVCTECLMKPFEIDALISCVARYVRLPCNDFQRLRSADSSETALTLSGRHIRSRRCISRHVAVKEISDAPD